jgi:FKBP-type peptidyl-prolyl cis-trans isomerase FkpA
MRKLTILLAILFPIALFTTSCLDTSNDDYQKQLDELQKQVDEQFGKDTLIIQQYLADHQLTAQVQKETGIYYIINEPGDEYHPNDYSVITVNYKGLLANDTIFNQTKVDEPYTSILNQLISGWRYGIPLIGTGGKITLFLPSFYGYGTESKAKIPANSVLIFEIGLVSFY